MEVPIWCSCSSGMLHATDHSNVRKYCATKVLWYESIVRTKVLCIRMPRLTYEIVMIYSTHLSCLQQQTLILIVRLPREYQYEETLYYKPLSLSDCSMRPDEKNTLQSCEHWLHQLHSTVQFVECPFNKLQLDSIDADSVLGLLGTVAFLSPDFQLRCYP